jgi:uncharacterized protein YfaS (alpha-2-macroglobulin family)
MVFLLLTLGLYGAGKRDALWKAVAEAESKGLPKTAIEKLGPIISGAIADKAYPEAIKAVVRRIAFEGQIEGEKPEEKIARVEAEIAKAAPEMVPTLKTIEALWYWEYFQYNRWRFAQRTQTTTEPGKDITTWDLPRLFAEIDKRFAEAMANEAELKKIPVGDFDALLENGTLPDSYRPTLFDFLAHQALDYYTVGEQAGAKAEDTFEIAAESPIFGTTEEFLKWEPATTDDSSVTLKAVKLLQKLVRFHLEDADKSALLRAELDRLRLGYNKAVGEEKTARYKAALKRFIERWGDQEVSAWARLDLARVLMSENDFVEARRLAKEGAGAFAKTAGGAACHNLVLEIEAKALTITTERVWNAPWPDIDVHYKNLAEVHFRVVRANWTERLNRRGQPPGWLDEEETKALLKEKPVREWEAKLPATLDYRERDEDVAVPQDLPPGFYFLIASANGAFSEKDNVVAFADFWVSNLALVMRTEWGRGKVEGFVLEANSGEPIAGAEVQTWVQEDRFKKGPSAKTDANGFFSMEPREGRAVLAQATFKDQQLVTANMYYNQRYNRNADTVRQTVFFTDRSLYRPGQTIQFKGVCLSTDRDRDKYRVLDGIGVTVIFQDANGKPIAKQDFRTNDYGSFSGSFTAPSQGLMGRMSLVVQGTPPGMAWLNVEEYKRPKFQVSLEAPKVPGKLNEKVQLEGKATAYTGAAIGEAKLRYRVTREVRYPIWWGWRYYWRSVPVGAAQEITHGTAMTKADGTFTIEFTARPDLSIPEKDEPTFNYAVHVDVTDTTGETRTAQRSVNVGYTALQASLAADEWQMAGKEVVVKVSTQTLDGEGQGVEAVLKVYALKQPAQVVRAPLAEQRPRGRRGMPRPIKKPDAEHEPDLSNPNSWELGEVVAERTLATDGKGEGAAAFVLDAGAYRAVLETKDRFGKKVTAELPLQVLKLDGKPLAMKIPYLVAAPKWTLEPGEQFTALWGTGYERARAFIEIEHRNQMVQSFWTEQGLSQQQVKLAVTEAQRGGFTVHVTMVRENRAYFTSRHVDVPWSNKKLSVKWEHFVSKLEPAQKETWTAVITGPDAKKAVAEMVAALYDQSLDAYLPHRWLEAFAVFRQDYSQLTTQFENSVIALQQNLGGWVLDYKDARATYRKFPDFVTPYYFNRGEDAEFGVDLYYRGRAPGGIPMPATLSAAPMAAMAPEEAPKARGVTMFAADAVPQKQPRTKGLADEPAAPPAAPEVDLSKISARKNLQETAFFFPQLVAREDGSVAMEFTMPEALTTWRFIGFAHDRELRSGYLEDKVITAKDLMVEPNAPRFLREGDTLAFTVKVSNQSATRQSGVVKLTLANARTGQVVDADFGNKDAELKFDLPAGEAKSLAWKLAVPDGAEPLSYKAVGGTGKISDGEEGLLPVLTKRVLVTESLPLPIRGEQTKKFEFQRLLEAAKSDTLKSQTLTVQMVSNPSWYAVMALPYLMEFPHECSEQTFNRLYANALARHIAQSDPKIHRVFEQWKGTPALDSPLEKNQDVKMVMIEETPWLRQAQAESQSRRNVGILFDDNRLNNETAKTLRKLADMQLGDGQWPWFPGGRGNEYITLYIVTGFGRLQHLGVKIDPAPAVKALGSLDAWIDRLYRDILKHGDRKANNLSPTIAFYLYGRSFFLADHPIAGGSREAVDYFLGQAREYWLKLERQSQGHLALALKRFGDKAVAQGIMRSIKENAKDEEEMGMYWRDAELSWWWYRAPIETQALMIEAFDEVMNDATAVEDCKVWLLKQKQTQDWKTTKATADAIYALLLRGDNVLASDALVQMTIGGEVIKPEKVEAGTGFYEQKFVRGEIKPEQGHISLKKTDKGVSWGSVHWQYLEDMSKVTGYAGTPLKLEKALFTRELTKKGPVLEPVKGPVKVGDELVVRVVLRTDRDMEYVHLKDYRGSGTEPVNVLSQYKFQDGLAYYESTRDTASHFFIDYLPKGTYVFEYTTRVVHRGKYQTGFAGIECMYAPEFNSHSESLWVEAE